MGHMDPVFFGVATYSYGRGGLAVFGLPGRAFFGRLGRLELRLQLLHGVQAH